MELPDTHRRVLEALRRWGMVMSKSFELTGMGRRYAGGDQGRLFEMAKDAEP